MGIEPTSSAWKAEVLPLNYTRNLVKKLPITCIRQKPGHQTPQTHTLRARFLHTQRPQKRSPDTQPGTGAGLSAILYLSIGSLPCF